MNRDIYILIIGVIGFVGFYVLWWFLKVGYIKFYGLWCEGSLLDLLVEVVDRISWRIVDIIDYFGVEDVLENIEVVIYCVVLVFF